VSGLLSPPVSNSAQQQPAGRVALRRRIAAAGARESREIILVEALVATGKLALDAVEEFVSSAREAGRGLVDHALVTEVCDEQFMLTLTSRIYGIDRVNITEYKVEDDLVALLTPEQARRWHAMPFSRTDTGELMVAISDPANVEMFDTLPRVVKQPVAWRLVPASELAALIDKHYRRAAMAQTAKQVAAQEASEERKIVRQASSQPIVKLVNELIANAYLEGASDIHLEPKPGHLLVRYRVDGDLHEATTIPEAMAPNVIARIKHLARIKLDERREPQDGRFTWVGDSEQDEVDLRVVTVPAVHGDETMEMVVLRLLPKNKGSWRLDELGMSKENLQRWKDAIRQPYGVAIVTGPTGAGKSTTLTAALEEVWDPTKAIITIEDPVEYQNPKFVQIDVSGTMTRMTFASVLPKLLRSDPDVLMVGEIRDEETAQIAMEAAMTGHFVYTTLHTNDAASAVDRLTELNVPRFILANVIEAIVAQRLVRVLCRDCRIPQQVSAEELVNVYRAPVWVIQRAEANGGALQVFDRAEHGCGHCNGRGYRGRTGIYEVLRITDEMKQAILKGATSVDIEKLARRDGMTSMRDDAFQKALDGVTWLSEVLLRTRTGA